MAKVTRPWQGTLMGVLAYIGMVVWILLAIGAFVGGNMLSSYIQGLADASSQAYPMSIDFVSLFADMAWAFGIGFLVFALIDFFFARGFMVGWRWVVILVTILYVISLIGTIVATITGGTQTDILVGNIISLVIIALFTWLMIVLWKHPYYNQK